MFIKSRRYVVIMVSACSSVRPSPAVISETTKWNLKKKNFDGFFITWCHCASSNYSLGFLSKIWTSSFRGGVHPILILWNRWMEFDDIFADSLLHDSIFWIIFTFVGCFVDFWCLIQMYRFCDFLSIRDHFRIRNYSETLNVICCNFHLYYMIFFVLTSLNA